MSYVNPLKEVAGLIAERIDQGADFSGTGNILAAGNGKVLAATGNDSGWPGGGWITYQLTDGPLSGQIVYVAEDVKPTVSAGQTVHAGQTIAHMFAGSSGIETGWAANSHEPMSQTAGAGSISGANLPGGGADPTAVGKNFDEFLVSLGVKRAPNFGSPVGGKLPSSLKGQGGGGTGGGTSSGSGGSIGGPSGFDWTSGLLDAIPGFDFLGKGITGVSGTFSNVGDVAKSISGFVTEMSMIIKWVSWLFQPANWVRIGAGMIGWVLLILATTMLVMAAK